MHARRINSQIRACQGAGSNRREPRMPHGQTNTSPTWRKPLGTNNPVVHRKGPPLARNSVSTVLSSKRTPDGFFSKVCEPKPESTTSPHRKTRKALPWERLRMSQYIKYYTVSLLRKQSVGRILLPRKPLGRLIARDWVQDWDRLSLKVYSSAYSPAAQICKKLAHCSYSLQPNRQLSTYTFQTCLGETNRRTATSPSYSCSRKIKTRTTVVLVQLFVARPWFRTWTPMGHYCKTVPIYLIRLLEGCSWRTEVSVHALLLLTEGCSKVQRRVSFFMVDTVFM